jgi:hypothetical protein
MRSFAEPKPACTKGFVLLADYLDKDSQTGQANLSKQDKHAKAIIPYNINGIT